MLVIRGLRVGFRTRGGVLDALQGVDLAVPEGRITGLVGESGSGKSLTALAIMRLLPGEATILGGEVLLDGEDVLGLPESRMARVRGGRIAMVFQQPRASLNPVFPIETQLLELLRLHRHLNHSHAVEQAHALLRRVGLPEPGRIMGSYPHQLSGGMCQRVMIAMALACNPSILIADEPTTALDVTVQHQIVELLRELQRDLGLTVLLITHDLGLVAELCDDVNVMYAGRIVKSAGVSEAYARTAHPYTRGLMRARVRAGSTDLPDGIAGHVPELGRMPSGCPFHPRCDFARDTCRDTEPLPEAVQPGHTVRCHAWREVLV